MSEPYVPLFQEELAKRQPPHWEFWMLVGCVMVNRAQWATARPIHALLMKNTLGLPKVVAGLSGEELVPALRPLGFQVSRARVIRNLASRWVERPPANWREVQAIVGIGQYAADSWAIFVDKKLTQRPQDKRLKQYLKEQRRLKAERFKRKAV